VQQHARVSLHRAADVAEQDDRARTRAAPAPGQLHHIAARTHAAGKGATQIDARSAAGDILTGDAGDWVMQYAPGDYGVVKAARFAKVYRDA